MRDTINARSDASCSEVVHKGQVYAGLRKEWDQELGSYRYSSAREDVGAGSFFIPLLHGMGPVTSSAGSMLSLLNILTASKKRKGRSKSLKQLRLLPHYRIYRSEAIDLPGCFELPPDDSIQSLTSMCAWVDRWVRQSIVRHADNASSKPLVVPIARCASATIVLEMLRNNPNTFAGLILLSPMLPSDTEHSNSDLLDRVLLGECDLNQRAFDLMNGMNYESTWETLDDPFHVPTLILTGAEDQQTSNRARKKIRSWSHRLPHVCHQEFQTGHDVLNLRQGKPSIDAFELVYDFLARVGSR